MDGTTLQPLIDLGYALSARFVGLPNRLYRPNGPTAPIAPATLLGTLPAFFATEPNLKLVRPGAYKDATRFGAFDYAQAQVGDYLVGPTGLTHFISEMTPLEVAQCVECNRVLSFTRTPSDAPANPTADGGPELYGFRPMSAPITDTPAGDTALMTGWPASVLLGTKGERAPASGDLPDDSRDPWWAIKLPVSSGVPIENTDRITDDLGRTYAVSAAELTARGWNLTAMQVFV